MRGKGEGEGRNPEAHPRVLDRRLEHRLPQRVDHRTAHPLVALPLPRRHPPTLAPPRRRTAQAPLRRRAAQARHTSTPAAAAAAVLRVREVELRVVPEEVRHEGVLRRGVVGEDEGRRAEEGLGRRVLRFVVVVRARAPSAGQSQSFSFPRREPGPQ